MATLDELAAQVAALTAQVEALTSPPTEFYTSKNSGEEIDTLLEAAGGGVRYDAAQSLTEAQKAQARENIGLTSTASEAALQALDVAYQEGVNSV